MDRGHATGPGGDPRAERRIVLEAVTFRSGHGLLKACTGDVGWKNAGAPCAAPEWTPEQHVPVSHTLGERVELTLALGAAGARGPLEIVGEGPKDLRFAGDEAHPAARVVVDVGSAAPLPSRIAKISFDVAWSAGDGETVSPRRTRNVVYSTAGRPRDNQQARFPEDGVTLKRMDRAVEWVARLDSLDPRIIVQALMRKFPYYALHPSPSVPRRYHHPTYYNDEGGAWPMSDYVKESGECQAIVRLVRGILRQLGVPAEARAVLVWSDPEVDGGRKAVSAYFDEDPGAGLDRTKVVGDRRWLAALVDSPVEVGKAYPPSHTPVHGRPSPGFNRFEACLELTYDGQTVYYGGGDGVHQSTDDVIDAFWGLVWVSEAPREGFRVEEIVARYR